MNRCLLWGLLLVPLAAIGIQFVGTTPRSVEEPRGHLRERVVSLLPGWTVRDRPIAETDEMKKSVGELLNFDDALFRTYQRGGQLLNIYIAYWRPGKMSHRLVEAHTPDVCWVAAGWTRTECKRRLVPSLSATRLAIAEYRVFELEGARQTVLFWHFAGARLISYDRAGTPPWWAPLRDLVNEGLNQRERQYFIRVSSPLAIEQWEGDLDASVVLKSLANLVEGQ